MSCKFCHNIPKNKLKRILLLCEALEKICDEDSGLSIMIHNIPISNLKKNEWDKEERVNTSGNHYFTMSSRKLRRTTLFSKDIPPKSLP